MTTIYSPFDSPGRLEYYESMERAPVLFHVDLDAFYAAVETLDNPALQGKPVIVGGSRRRGVVSSCSYEARRYGIHSAMPMAQACRRCPQAVVLPVRMDRYLEFSERVMEALKSYTPDFRQISIDEASLDLSGTERLYGPSPGLARKIKDRIRREMGLTLSIGIAPNRYLAKLASEHGKPDGLWVVEPGGELAFLDRLELKDLWGVGQKTLDRLQGLRIDSIKGLRQISKDTLQAAMGEALAAYLYRAVRGLEPHEMYGLRPKSHSMSSEITFQTDKQEPEILERYLLELAQQVMYRLIRGGFRSNTVFLKLRFSDFTTIHCQKSVKHWIGSSDEIYALAGELLHRKWKDKFPIRLIGVGLAKVESGAEGAQGELFQDSLQKRRRVEEAVAGIRARMSGGKLTKASLLNPKRR